MGGLGHSLVLLLKEKWEVAENGRGTILERGGGSLSHAASMEREMQGILNGLKEEIILLTKVVETLSTKMKLG